jgi:hypothetical protein
MPLNRLSFNIGSRCCNFDVVWKGRPTFQYLCYQQFPASPSLHTCPPENCSFLFLHLEYDVVVTCQIRVSLSRLGVSLGLNWYQIEFVPCIHIQFAVGFPLCA